MVKRVLVLLVVALVLLSGTCLANHWILVKEDKIDGNRFIEIDSMRYYRPYGNIDKNIVEVWTKHNYSLKFMEDRIAFAKRTKIYTEQWESIDHEKQKWRFNIATGECTMVYVVVYDIEGNAIYSKNTTEKYEPVIPETVAAFMLDIVKIAAESNEVQ